MGGPRGSGGEEAKQCLLTAWQMLWRAIQTWMALQRASHIWTSPYGDTPDWWGHERGGHSQLVTVCNKKQTLFTHTVTIVTLLIWKGDLDFFFFYTRIACTVITVKAIVTVMNGFHSWIIVYYCDRLQPSHWYRTIVNGPIPCDHCERSQRSQ